jgi:regulator of chromosome condensation
LKERYLKGYGEVLTFGSGDCGQLAHGVEEDDDLMVKFPRVVYSLR